jgi:hypothetical protein
MEIIKSLTKVTCYLKPLLDNYDEYCLQWTTLHYIWTVHKCGILVTFFDGVLNVIPFVNDRFDNRLSWPKHNLTFQLDNDTFNNADEYYKEKQKRYKISESKIGIHKDQSKWWLNGHLVCNTLDEWSTRSLQELHKILPLIVKDKDIFFINRRDFPIYSEISSFIDAFGLQPQVPMFHGRKFGKICSYYGSEHFKDLLWPPIEHWSLNVPYVAKTILKAVFRGTLTGLSFTDSNPRLYCCRINNTNINAGLTAWTNRDRILNGNVHYRGPSVFLMPKMSIQEQCAYAIIIYIDGHVSSSRLAWNLLSGSLVIYVKSECRAPLQWLHTVESNGIKLTDGIHYVSCIPEDLSNTVDKYLKDHINRNKIGFQARSWALNVLKQESMIQYCQNLLQSI